VSFNCSGAHDTRAVYGQVPDATIPGPACYGILDWSRDPLAILVCLADYGPSAPQLPPARQGGSGGKPCDAQATNPASRPKALR